MSPINNCPIFSTLHLQSTWIKNGAEYINLLHTAIFEVYSVKWGPDQMCYITIIVHSDNLYYIE